VLFAVLKRIFCRHEWGVPNHGTMVCYKCGNEHSVPALDYDRDADRMRLEAARKAFLEVQKQLAEKKSNTVDIKVYRRA